MPNNAHRFDGFTLRRSDLYGPESDISADIAEETFSLRSGLLHHTLNPKIVLHLKNRKNKQEKLKRVKEGDNYSVTTQVEIDLHRTFCRLVSIDYHALTTLSLRF